MRTNHVPAIEATPTGRLPYAVQAAEPTRTRAVQPDTDGAREHTDDDTLTYKAAGLYVATAAYREALTMPNPAATLDAMCDTLPEIMPDVCEVVSAAREFTETLRATIADYLRAYTAIEHARIEAGDSSSYLFDLLAEGLQNGVDPQITRTTALAAPGRIRELAEDCA